MATRGCFVLALLVCAGCRLTAIDPEPFTGPAPTSIAIWPLATDGPAAAEPGLMTGLDGAVAGRGYQLVSVAVARQLLGDAGVLPGAGVTEPADLAAVGRALGVDAVLVLDVNAFASDRDARRGRLSSARWDLGWRLLSTGGDGQLWQHQHRGSWRRDAGEDFDPSRPLDEPPRPVPIGGDRKWHFRDRQELIANLHLQAMQHLPRRPR